MYITIDLIPRVEFETEVETHWVSKSYIKGRTLVLNKFPVPHHHIVSIIPNDEGWRPQQFTIGANEVDPVVHITLVEVIKERYGKI